MVLSGIILGFVQGLTEFLPVSSSGHLVILQSKIAGFTQPGVLFDVILHLGTTLAVLIYFRREILKLKFRDYVIIIIGTIPAAFAGVLFGDAIESLFTSIKVVGFALIVTGFLNLLTDKAAEKGVELSGKRSFLIGIAQSIATIPGISRSGSTIFAGTYLGINREAAARFSFLLSVPAVLGATGLEFIKHPEVQDINCWIYASGFFAALVSGILSIKLVMNLLKSRNFKIFGFYCLVVGVLVISIL